MPQIRSILISGGWGYGNIGDDAILVATLKLVRRRFPEARLVVTSYDPASVAEIAAIFGAEVRTSLHKRFVSGTVFPERFQMHPGRVRNPRGHALGRNLRRLRHDAFAPLVRRADRTLPQRHDRFLGNGERGMRADFQGYDLFLQAGGGYFNGDWKDSAYSRALELRFAKEAGCRTLVLGQTIGPFQELPLRERVQSALRTVDAVCIRDTESKAEIEAMGVACSVLPDSALSDVRPSVEPTNVLTFVFWEGQPGDLEFYADLLARFAKETGANVELVSTRLWNPDIWASEKLCGDLIARGIAARHVIPIGPEDLQEALARGRMIVSYNLHGLILAWRAGVPCVCLNSGRKFVAFMEQTNQRDFLVNSTTRTSEGVLGTFHSAWRRTRVSEADRNEIGDAIHRGVERLWEVLEA